MRLHMTPNKSNPLGILVRVPCCDSYATPLRVTSKPTPMPLTRTNLHLATNPHFTNQPPTSHTLHPSPSPLASRGEREGENGRGRWGEGVGGREGWGCRRHPCSLTLSLTQHTANIFASTSAFTPESRLLKHWTSRRAHFSGTPWILCAKAAAC